MNKFNKLNDLLYGPKEFRKITTQVAVRLKRNLSDSSEVKFDRYSTRINLNEFKIEINPYQDSAVEINIISNESKTSCIVVSELNMGNIIGSIKDIITKLFKKAINI